MFTLPFIERFFRRIAPSQRKVPAQTISAHDYAVLVLGERDELDRRATYLHLSILQATILRAQFGQARLEAFLAVMAYEAYQRAYVLRRQEMEVDFEQLFAQPEISPGTFYVRGSRLIFWVRLRTSHRLSIDLVSGQVLVGDRRRMAPLRLRPTAELGLTELIGRCRLVDTWQVIRHALILREGA